jgi:hypothetical protein
LFFLFLRFQKYTNVSRLDMTLICLDHDIFTHPFNVSFMHDGDVVGPRSLIQALGN